MDLNSLVTQLRQLSTRTYSYVLLSALIGPLLLRLLGLGALGRLVRPLALAVLLGGVYARQQGQSDMSSR